MRPLQKWEKTFLKVLFVLGVVMVGLLAYSVHAWHEFTRPKSEPADLAKVSALTGLTFPQGARLKRSRYVKYFPMVFLWAEVVIPSQEVETFKQTTGERAKMTWTPGYRMTEIAPKWMEKEGVKPPPWWHPESVQDGMGGAGAVRLDERLEVLISQPPNAPSTVYLRGTWG
jgi:hypothetical protein